MCGRWAVGISKAKFVCTKCTDSSETASQSRKKGFALVLLMRSKLVEAVQLKQNQTKAATTLSQAVRSAKTVFIFNKHSITGC